MTAYHGGKQRIGKRISQVICHQTHLMGSSIKGYCEPFCGMLGVYQHIFDIFPDGDYLAGDTNKSVIEMWKASKNAWKPPTYISESDYNKLKKSDDSAIKGYVGHQYSFGGKYFKGYAPKYGKNSDSTTASKRVVDIGNKLQLHNVVFSHGSYEQYSHLKDYVIYCDPPYMKTESHYKATFSSSDFYDWCRNMSKNNIVLVSEYEAPDDFIPIWSNTSKLTGVSKSEGGHVSKVRVEKLFLI